MLPQIERTMSAAVAAGIVSLILVSGAAPAAAVEPGLIGVSTSTLSADEQSSAGGLGWVAMSWRNDSDAMIDQLDLRVVAPPGQTFRPLDDEWKATVSIVSHDGDAVNVIVGAVPMNVCTAGEATVRPGVANSYLHCVFADLVIPTRSTLRVLLASSVSPEAEVTGDARSSDVASLFRPDGSFVNTRVWTHVSSNVGTALPRSEAPTPGPTSGPTARQNTGPTPGPTARFERSGQDGDIGMVIVHLLDDGGQPLVGREVRYVSSDGVMLTASSTVTDLRGVSSMTFTGAHVGPADVEVLVDGVRIVVTEES